MHTYPERERERERFDMKDQAEGQRELISPFCNQRYTEMAPQQEAPELMKPKRRRRRVRTGGEERKKRKLSEEQVNFLEMNFGNEHKLESERKDRLASELGLDPRQVAVWFQNRRARWKNQKLEEEYSILKSSHQSVLLDRCRLESEMTKLKEQLEEAQKEIQRLCNVSADNGTSSNSPSSSLSVENLEEAPFLGEFGLEYVFDMSAQPQNAYYHGMEWIHNLCI